MTFNKAEIIATISLLITLIIVTTSVINVLQQRKIKKQNEELISLQQKQINNLE